MFFSHLGKIDEIEVILITFMEFLFIKYIISMDYHIKHIKKSKKNIK